MFDYAKQQFNGPFLLLTAVHKFVSEISACVLHETEPCLVRQAPSSRHKSPTDSQGGSLDVRTGPFLEGAVSEHLIVGCVIKVSYQPKLRQHCLF